MSTVTSVQMWKCPATGKLFDSPEGAQKSLKLAKAKEARKKTKEKQKEELLKLIEYQSNYVRLNATSFNNIPKLIETKAKEFWKMNLKVTITGDFRNRFNTRYSYDPEIGPYWSARVKISGDALGETQTEILKKLGCDLRRDPCFRGMVIGSTWSENPAAFKGIRLGSGCGGSFGKYSLEMDAEIHLSDFPLIEARYKEYLALKGPKDDYDQKVRKIEIGSGRFCEQTKSVKEQKLIVDRAKSCWEAESSIYERLRTEAMEEYTKFCMAKLGPVPKMPPELEQWFG